MAKCALGTVGQVLGHIGRARFGATMNILSPTHSYPPGEREQTILGPVHSMFVQPTAEPVPPQQRLTQISILTYNTVCV